MPKCELCEEDLIYEETHIVAIVDLMEEKILPLQTMKVCDKCFNMYEFTIGAVEWEES